MAYTLLSIVNIIERLITYFLFAHIILSYILSPFHPVRQFIGKVISPMLDPIRRIMPPTGGIDFSPMALWLIVYLLGNVLKQLIINVF